MCGIVGVISTTALGLSMNDITRFNQMLVCDSIRGPDSTGVFSVNKYGNASFLKTKGNPFELLNSTEYTTFNNETCKNGVLLIGHNRKATIGKIRDETAHPFQEEHIILVHNGTLYNYKNLTDQEVEVDSHAITHAILEKGYKKALRELQGAFTLVWYDAKDKCLRFVRNDQRPLSIIKSRDKIFLSSEATLGEWIIARDAYGFTYKTEDVKPGYVYSIKIDNIKQITKERVHFYAPPKPKITTTTYTKENNTKKLKAPGFGGWDGYECRSGDKIVVLAKNVAEYVKGKDNYIAVLRGERIFPNQPPVYVFLTPEEFEYYTESGELFYVVTVDRMAYIDGTDKPPTRIYASKLEEYEPAYDTIGDEVMLEEWKSLSSHKCKQCGKDTYWKDINQTRFKFKTKYNHLIICKDCMSTKGEHEV